MDIKSEIINYFFEELKKNKISEHVINFLKQSYDKNQKFYNSELIEFLKEAHIDDESNKIS